MYGIQDKINQILRGAETIRKNQSMLTAQSDSIELYHALCDMTKDLTQKTNEIARLRELWQETENVRDSWCEAYTQERDKNQKLRSAAQAVVERWETPLWKDAEPTALVIYRLRDALAPAPEEPVNECRCNNPSIIKASHNGKTYEQCSKCGKKFKITMEEWYNGFSKIKSTEPANPTCDNTTHKFSHCDCKEPVSLDHAPKISHEGNTDAKFKQLHEVASIIVEYIEDPDRRSYYRSQIQQLTPTTEETSKKDTSTETCPSQKDNEWREMGLIEGRKKPKQGACGKSVYQSQSDCDEAIKHRLRSKFGGTSFLRAYFCETCAAWHMSSSHTKLNK